MKIFNRTPVANRRSSRRPVGAATVAPIVNRLYRRLVVGVWMAADLSAPLLPTVAPDSID